MYHGDSEDDCEVYGAAPSNGALIPPVQDKVDGIDAEIKSINDQIKGLQQLKKSLEDERRKIFANARASQSSGSNGASSSKAGPSRLAAATDYTTSDFPWSGELLARAKQTWGIKSWRMCQEGVVNGEYTVVRRSPDSGGPRLSISRPPLLSPQLFSMAEMQSVSCQLEEESLYAINCQQS